MVIKRGDVFVADLSGVNGSEEHGTRPVIVVQNNIGNAHSSTTIVLPCSGAIKKLGLPVHVFTNSTAGLNRDTVILAEQIRTVDKDRLIRRLGHVHESLMRRVDDALKISLGLQEGR